MFVKMDNSTHIKLLLLTLFSVFTICSCLRDDLKFDCYPENKDVNETLCVTRGCQWQDVAGENPTNIPQCFYGPSHNFTFAVTSNQTTTLGEELRLDYNEKNTEKYPDGNLFRQPSVIFEEQTISRLRIKFDSGLNIEIINKIYVAFHRKKVLSKDVNVKIQISDSAKPRYEVPIQDDFPSSKHKPKAPMYSYTYQEYPFSIKVFAKRAEQTVKIWDTSVGAMILSDQFLQLSTALPTKYLYGIGENSRSSFKRDFSKWHSIGMFSKDAAPYPFHNTNLYGVHPFYMMMESSGMTHGVLLLNSNAMDITLQPTPALTYRTIGGVFDFYFFFGPTPENVVQQYTNLIGRPVFPSYWSLGFQLCRYGYNSLAEVKRTVDRMNKYDIPQDIQYGDIDYMERQLDFTYDNKTYYGLPDYVRQLKKDGIKYITILDPAISAEEEAGTYETYELGTQLDIWIKDENGKKALLGKVWPDRPNIFVNKTWPWDDQVKAFRANATFPDWFHSKIEQWWNKLIIKFHKTIPFDGLWIDMNEAANFVKGSIYGCPDNKYEKPPYKPQTSGDLSEKTLCMSAKHEDGEIEYNLHSLFGWKQAQITRKALSQTTSKRGIVISRSTYPSSGKYAGHWLGDNKSEWPQMHESIIGMMDFTLFGIPYSGADICGFNLDTTEELCHRWTQLGAFYPMSRNHNGLGFKPQDPAVFGKEFAQNAKDILHIRYMLLPYLYTLFYDAHTNGKTVVRPLFFEFPEDEETWNIDRQFMLGSALLITPILEKGATSTAAYFPNKIWIDYYSGSITKPGKQTLNIPYDKIGLHLKGGSVIPTQEPAKNTQLSRKNPMGLIVVFDNDFNAVGKLFWDDGDSLDSITAKKYQEVYFSASKSGLDISITENGLKTASNLTITKIHILGLRNKEISDITVNQKTDFTTTYSKNKVVIEDLNLHPTRRHQIFWTLKDIPSHSTTNQISLLLLMMSLFIVYLMRMLQ